MAAFDIPELDKSIESFQETILALKQIQDINRELESVAGKLGEQDATLKADTGRLDNAYQQITSALEELKGAANAYADNVKAAFAEHEKELGDKLNAHAESVKSSTDALRDLLTENTAAVTALSETVAEKAAATEKSVLDYTTGTQKSIDELRVLETNNARETRDKIVETDARARAEMDAHFKSVEQLTAELAAMKAQQRKAQIIGLVTGGAATFAAISSILHFFF